jgi:multiple sugar transport system ATP-binding protein
MLNGTLESRADGSYWVRLGSQALRVQESVLHERSGLRKFADQVVVVGIRPEDMEDAEIIGQEDGQVLRSVADLVEAMGSDVLVHFPVDVEPVVSDDITELINDKAGAESGVLAEQGITVVVGRFSPRTRVFEGQDVMVRVDTSRLHFFDPSNGSSIWD